MVVGAGPNGLAAAIEVARHGFSVLVLERAPEPGGAARTEEATLPGFLHDTASAVYPLGAASPFFRALPLERYGLVWAHGRAPVAHALAPERAVLAHHHLDETARALGADGPVYRRLVDPFVRHWDRFVTHVLDAPARPPRAPLLMARFAGVGLRSARSLAARFRTPEARALLAGNAAHAALPLERGPGAAYGVVLLAAAHAVGWPVPRGGAGALTRALAAHLHALGGELRTGVEVTNLQQLPAARAVILDLSPRTVARLLEPRVGARAVRREARWPHGPGAYKVDWALDGPIPWLDPGCADAITVHVGGSFEEVAAAERAPFQGRAPDPPFLLLAQPSLFDTTRAPPGGHTAWAYAHVPNGWTGDLTEAVERRIETFAPGFRDRILARRVLTPSHLEAWNPNLVGGDPGGGLQTWARLFGPSRWGSRGWRTPLEHVYVCSAATPPGGGVHGMCGYHAARLALRRSFGVRATSLRTASRRAP